jgi:hypothetical protein
MNWIDDPLKLMTDLWPGTLDHLADQGFARNRDDDLARAAADRTAHRPPGRGRRSRAGHGRPRRYLMTGAVAVTAAAAVVATVVLAGKPPPGAPRPSPAPGAHATPGQLITARQVLLTAAAHVASAPTTGAYWRIRETSGRIWPAGTNAHPYDISLVTSFDQWNPRSAGQKGWNVFQALGAVPATPADAAAWRAAGSPATWHSGLTPSRSNHAAPYPGAGGAPRSGELSATTVASRPGASWQVSDGIVGYVEGDLPGLTAAQFRRMPATPAGVAAVLRHYAEMTFCIQHPSAGCSTEDQLVWAEALDLLLDPVSPQVRSATFRVMASLPGVRLLGPMTDPLGRHGYGIAAGRQSPSYDPAYNPVSAVVIDPRGGSLLATEDIDPMPRNVQCQTVLLHGGDAGQGTPVITMRFPHGRNVTAACVGSSYEGRSYPGQVDSYTVVVSAGWTDASPVPPPAQARVSGGYLPGYPTMQFVPCQRVGC